MTAPAKLFEKMRCDPQNVQFHELARVWEEYFGKPRQSGGSHMIFKTPWLGDPRVNIQDENGRAKTHQVRQVLLAIDKLKGEHA